MEETRSDIETRMLCLFPERSFRDVLEECAKYNYTKKKKKEKENDTRIIRETIRE